MLHLDTCQFRTVLCARVPRVQCAAHGVRQIRVPWAEEHSRFTLLFEALAIRVLRETTLSGLATLMRLSWDEAEGIFRRAVARGLAGQRQRPLRILGVDETTFQKRHKYVTVVADLASPQVLWVGDHRRQETLGAFWQTLTPTERQDVEAVIMDMWDPDIAATRAGLKVGRAWAIKEAARQLWAYRSATWALKYFRRWYGWATCSRLGPIIRVARMMKHYLRGILAYLRHRYTNALTEALNAKIQELKYRAWGYRNRDNFRLAILFHCGGLDMNPC